MKKPVIAALMLAATAHAAEETAVPALVVKPGRISNTGDFVVGYRFAVDCSVKVGHYDLEGAFGVPDFMW